ncbi:DUF3492 domain-containing protein [Streptomyces iconiensis]|uniref:DUF3492 domain-containing protein n=1 Tax=Streptomyces iconiensis TaxID=1384038 RepID=A0ABT7A5S1_9ACTN|nr:DUF3492 domain-containing protein [Streptomyces iconiensis]MDJ1136665.1 DUF3492 domain-containing protein [Streptomyces iconiensis]
MRVALLTEGGFPYARGESALWCDRLLRGLEGHEFGVYALSRGPRQEAAGWRELPRNVVRVRTAPLWGPGPGPGPGSDGGAVSYGRRERRRFAEHFTALAEAVCAGEAEDGGEGPAAEEAGVRQSTAQADRFAAGLYGLAELASERGGLAPALRSEFAVRILESACRAPGALRAAHAAQVADLLAVTERLERALRPLSLDWYGARGEDPGLSAADLCHAVGGGLAALPGLLAARAYGVPLLITEYGVRLREHYLASAAGAVAPRSAGAPVRALLASFQGRLTREAYAQAQLITPGNAHARRWQERCGAHPGRLRTVYPGMDAAPFEAVGERAAPAGPSGGPWRSAAPTLVWVGRGEPSKDLVALLHAFARVREAVPEARLRIVETGAGAAAEGPGGAADYGAHCRALAARMFPCAASDALSGGQGPVSFEELGSPAAPTLAEAYGSGEVVVLSSVVEGFPVPLVEAMFCGRATVSTDVGAVCEVIGGTGLVVPPRNPRALADACVALLRDPARCALLGAAARSRALELFTVEQNTEAFRGIYLELMSHRSVRADGGAGGAVAAPGGEDASLPFACPAEAHVPGRWAGTARRVAAVATGGRRAGTGTRPPRTPADAHGGALPPVPSWATPERASDGAPAGRPAGRTTEPVPGDASGSPSGGSGGGAGRDSEAGPRRSGSAGRHGVVGGHESAGRHEGAGDEESASVTVGADMGEAEAR